MSSDDRPTGPLHAASIIGPVQQRFRDFALPSWPVFSLSRSVPQPGWLCGAGESTNGLTCLRIDYRRPGDTERLIVQTQLATDRAVDLPGVIAQLTNADGEPLVLHSTATTSSTPPNAEVSVDGRVTAARTMAAGNSEVWALNVAGVTLVVAASQVEIQTIALTRISDLRPYQNNRDTIIETFLTVKPPPDLSSS